MSGFCARREMASRYSLELKNFRLRRASKQPLSDVSRAGKQVCAGQKSVPQTHFVGEPVTHFKFTERRTKSTHLDDNDDRAAAGATLGGFDTGSIERGDVMLFGGLAAPIGRAAATAPTRHHATATTALRCANESA